MDSDDFESNRKDALSLDQVRPESALEDVCQICQMDGTAQLAVSFCRDCNVLLCAEHQKQHDKFHSGIFSRKHEIIQVSEYCKAKAKFSPRVCSQHPDNKVDGMCIKCRGLNCAACRSFMDDFNCASGEKHRSRPIQELADDMQVKVTDAQADMVRLISELDELAELSEKKGADNEVELDNLIAIVDRVMDEQLKEIKRKYEEMKARINVVREENLERKRQYQNDIQKRVKGLHDLLTDMNLSLETKHQIDVIRDGEVLCERLAKARHEKTIPLEFMRQQLMPAEKIRGVEVQLLDVRQLSDNLPVGLTDDRVIRISTRGCCLCVSHTRDGGLVAGGQGGFDVQDARGELIVSVTLAGQITGCTVSKEHIYVLQCEGSRSRVRIYSLGGKELTSWPVTYDSYNSNLALVGESIIVPVSTQKRVEVYSMQGQLLRDNAISHPSFSGSWLYVAATSQDTFITTDNSSQMVTKFSTLSGESVWQAKGPAAPFGPAVDAAGRIWVPSYIGKAVHVLSSEGTFINEFAVPNVNCVWGLSVHRDQLVLAGNTCLHFSKMTY